jgi:hypothetical protein
MSETGLTTIYLTLRLLVVSGVAVEKLPFFQNRSKFWDRKCLVVEENRLQSFLTRFNFCGFFGSEFFNSHRPYH